MPAFRYCGNFSVFLCKRRKMSPRNNLQTPVSRTLKIILLKYCGPCTVLAQVSAHDLTLQHEWICVSKTICNKLSFFKLAFITIWVLQIGR